MVIIRTANATPSDHDSDNKKHKHGDCQRKLTHPGAAEVLDAGFQASLHSKCAKNSRKKREETTVLLGSYTDPFPHFLMTIQILNPEPKATIILAL